MSLPATRDFLRAMMAEDGHVVPARVMRARPQVRTGDSIPAAPEMILYGVALVVLDIPIEPVALPALRANRTAIEQNIRAAVNYFGGPDDPDPVRRRNLRYNGMYLETRDGKPFLRVTFSGKSGRLIGAALAGGPGGVGVGPDQGIITPSLVPPGVRNVREVMELVVNQASPNAPPLPATVDWQPTAQLFGALEVLLNPAFGYRAVPPQLPPPSVQMPPPRVQIFTYDPYAPLDP